MAGQGQAVRRATTTCDNSVMQKSISEHTDVTLRWTRIEQRKPHIVPLLSARNITLRLHWAQIYQKWKAEDWKCVGWAEES